MGPARRLGGLEQFDVMVRPPHAQERGLAPGPWRPDDAAEVVVPDLAGSDDLKPEPVGEERQRRLKLRDGEAGVVCPDNPRHAASPACGSAIIGYCCGESTEKLFDNLGRSGSSTPALACPHSADSDSQK